MARKMMFRGHIGRLKAAMLGRFSTLRMGDKWADLKPGELVEVYHEGLEDTTLLCRAHVSEVAVGQLSVLLEKHLPSNVASFAGNCTKDESRLNVIKSLAEAYGPEGLLPPNLYVCVVMEPA